MSVSILHGEIFEHPAAMRRLLAAESGFGTVDLRASNLISEVMPSVTPRADWGAQSRQMAMRQDDALPKVNTVRP